MSYRYNTIDIFVGGGMCAILFGGRLLFLVGQFMSDSSKALEPVMRSAQTVPVEHLARVEGITRRAIVNFTTRGIRQDLLSAVQDGTMYNMKMIGCL